MAMILSYRRAASRRRRSTFDSFCSSRRTPDSGKPKDWYGKIRPAPGPTNALPGTPEKVAILEERAKLGVSLWHEADAGMPLTRSEAALAG